MMSPNSNRYGEGTDYSGNPISPEVDSDQQERCMARDYFSQKAW